MKFFLCSLAVMLSVVINNYGVEASENSSNCECQFSEDNKNRTSLIVYYEAMCSDSVNLFKHQLFPTWQKHKNMMDLKIVPYGKAIHYNNNGTWLFSCQHGPKECELNILHSCILDNNEFDVAFPMIACLLASRHNVGNCSEEHNIDMGPVNTCATTSRGEELFVEAGQETNSIELSYVPSLEVDHQFSYSRQFHWFANFDYMLCRENFSKYNLDCYQECCQHRKS